MVRCANILTEKGEVVFRGAKAPYKCSLAFEAIPNLFHEDYPEYIEELNNEKRTAKSVLLDASDIEALAQLVFHAELPVLSFENFSKIYKKIWDLNYVYEDFSILLDLVKIHKRVRLVWDW